MGVTVYSDATMTKTVAGPFTEHNRPPVDPIYVTGNSVYFNVDAGNSWGMTNVCWGYRCTVSADLEEEWTKLTFFIDFARALGFVCGKAAGRLISGNAVTEDEKTTQEWLVSELLAEGMESSGEENVGLEWLPRAFYEDSDEAHKPDAEVDAFLEDLIECRGSGAAVIAKLEKKAPIVLLGPQSKARDASCVFVFVFCVVLFASFSTAQISVARSVRAVFAVMLKHNSYASEAVMFSFTPADVEPSELLLRTWRTANKLPKWLMQRYQQVRSKLSEEEDHIEPSLRPFLVAL